MDGFFSFGVVALQGPDINGVISGGANLIADYHQVGKFSVKPRGHFSDGGAADQGVAPVNRDLSVFGVERSNGVRVT